MYGRHNERKDVRVVHNNRYDECDMYNNKQHEINTV